MGYVSEYAMSSLIGQEGKFDLRSPDEGCSATGHKISHVGRIDSYECAATKRCVTFLQGS